MPHVKDDKAPIYDMGNNTFASGPDEAMYHFLTREFPEILGIKKGNSHNVMFIPDSFIYKGLTEKVRHILKRKKNKLHCWKNTTFNAVVLSNKVSLGDTYGNIGYF